LGLFTYEYGHLVELVGLSPHFGCDIEKLNRTLYGFDYYASICTEDHLGGPI